MTAVLGWPGRLEAAGTLKLEKGEPADAKAPHSRQRQLVGWHLIIRWPRSGYDRQYGRAAADTTTRLSRDDAR